MNLQEIADRRNGHRNTALVTEPDNTPDPSAPDDIPTLPPMPVPAQPVVTVDVVRIAKLIANALTNPNCRCWPDGNTFNIERVVKGDCGTKIRETFSVTIQNATKTAFQIIQL